MHTKGLLVGKALVCPLTGTVPVRIANPYNHSCKLYKDTIVASYEPVHPEQIISVNRTETLETDVKSCPKTEVLEHLTDVYSKSSECLTPEQQARLKELLIKYQNTFSKSKHDLGHSSLVEYEINVIPGTKPIKQQSYRMPLAKRQAAQDEIKAMADKDLIEESSSAWSSPVLILPKRDGSNRFCIDYRKLNKVTIPDSQPLPRCDESLDALGGSKWFSTDLRSGFHQ